MSYPSTCETWAPIPRFSNYEISDLGRVRRINAARNMPAGTLLKQKAGSRGYLKVSLSRDDGRRITFSVHVLVALVFLPAPNAGQTMVRHLDDVRTNNKLSNLARGTAKENTADARRNGRLALGEMHPSHLKPWTRPRGQVHTSAKLTENQVRQILATPGRQRDVAEMFGVNQALIQRIRTGKIWKHITNPAWIASENERLIDAGVVPQ